MYRMKPGKEWYKTAAETSKLLEMKAVQDKRKAREESRDLLLGLIKQSKRKKNVDESLNKTFIPFVQERDSVGRVHHQNLREGNVSRNRLRNFVAS